MQVVNMNPYAVQVKIVSAEGTDYVHIVSRGRVKLPTGFTVDKTFLIGNPLVKLVNTN